MQNQKPTSNILSVLETVNPEQINIQSKEDCISYIYLLYKKKQDDEKFSETEKIVFNKFIEFVLKNYLPNAGLFREHIIQVSYKILCLMFLFTSDLKMETLPFDIFTIIQKFIKETIKLHKENQNIEDKCKLFAIGFKFLDEEELEDIRNKLDNEVNNIMLYWLEDFILFLKNISKLKIKEYCLARIFFNVSKKIISNLRTLPIKDIYKIKFLIVITETMDALNVADVLKNLNTCLILFIDSIIKNFIYFDQMLAKMKSSSNNEDLDKNLSLMKIFSMYLRSNIDRFFEYFSKKIKK